MSKKITYFKEALLNSYAQVFFSDHLLFGCILMCATFFDFNTGLAGLTSAMIATIAAILFGFSDAGIRKGTYTFNSLLTGLAMGTFFEAGFNYFILLVLASVFSLFLSSALSAMGARLKLPFLSLPFILSTWLMLACVKHFSEGLITYRIIQTGLVATPETAIVGSLPLFATLFFKTLALIFFQKSVVAGILIAVGILVYSRISFLLSIVGFTAGYFYYVHFYPSFPQQDYVNAAFNYVLSAIALGGFFVLPSAASFLLVIVCSIIISLLVSLSAFLKLFELPLFSIPFSAGVWLVVAALREKNISGFLQMTIYQHYSPEKNLYTSVLYANRFKHYDHLKIQVPFYGEWTVSQGYDGEITHKNDHRYALDFVVTDEHRKSFKLPGKQVQDFFCYGLPVLSPANGTIVKVVDDVSENQIGQNNLKQNWGNLLVIRHAENVYSQLGHLAKNSIKVKEGDQVKTGEVLALCGNSGRSPEPHLHFQLQETSYVGEKTMAMPLHNYIENTNGLNHYVTFGIPRQGEIIQSPAPDAEIKKAFTFKPGQVFKFQTNNKIETWQVQYNKFDGFYFIDETYKSTASFTLTNELFEFSYFKGNKNCLLFDFFLAGTKVLFSSKHHLQISEELETGLYTSSVNLLFQDFLAPFKIFSKTKAKINTIKNEEDNGIRIVTAIHGSGKKDRHYEIQLKDGQITEIKINIHNKCIIAKNISA